MNTRFTPESGHSPVLFYVRFVPIADMKDLEDRTAHSPRPRNQMNAAIITCRKARTYPVAQCGTTIFGKRHAVAWRRCLTAEKRCPVVIKVLEYRWSIN